MFYLWIWGGGAGRGGFSIQYVVVTYRRAALTQPPRSVREVVQPSGVVKSSMGVPCINYVTCATSALSVGNLGKIR